MAHLNLLRRYADGDVKLCNCASCGTTLLSPQHRELYQLNKASGINLDDLPPFVAGRIKDRPHCDKCLKANRPPTLAENLTPRQAAKLTG
jgi:hypothetical protein